MVNRRKVTVFVRRFWSCLFLLCAISVYAHGQVMKNVSGVIKDAAGEPVIGVNVVLKGDATVADSATLLLTREQTLVK